MMHKDIVERSGELEADDDSNPYLGSFALSTRAITYCYDDEVITSGKIKVICFHGTTGANASVIRRLGFNKGTFFAKHLEDALEFGGAWVFQVVFDEDKLPPGCWQFRITDAKPHTDIVRVTHYAKVKKVFYNKALGKAIFDSDLSEKPVTE